jgi:hypothetical protein
VFPIVFAVQNLAAAWPTTLIQFHWALVKYGEARVASDFVTLGNGSTSGLDYITVWTPALNGPDAAGSYALGWDFTYNNCSDPHDITASGLVRNSTQGSFFFTIEPGAQQPDLAADPDACPAHHVTFEITGTISVKNFDNYHLQANEPREFCGIVAPSPPPASPCAARLDKTAASSIAAELTASACAASPPALTSGCPATTASEESLGVTVWLGSWTLMGRLLLAGLVSLVLH